MAWATENVHTVVQIATDILTILSTKSVAGPTEMLLGAQLATAAKTLSFVTLYIW